MVDFFRNDVNFNRYYGKWVNEEIKLKVKLPAAIGVWWIRYRVWIKEG